MTKTAFLFPGQGSQSVGMGRELAAAFPIARQTFEEANEALGFDLAELCFAGPEEQLRLTEFTQPAIFTVSVAALRVLAAAGATADYFAGHSLGEYSANVVPGRSSCRRRPHRAPPRAVDARGRARRSGGHGRHSWHASGNRNRRLPGCLGGGGGARRAGEHELSRTNGHLRSDSRGRAGYRAGQGTWGPPGRPAAGLRAIPLQPDATGPGCSRSGTGVFHSYRPRFRSWSTWMPRW